MISDNYLKKFILLSIGLISLSIIFPFTVNSFFSNWSTSGTFGDTFGALNAIFSGLAFSGIVVTILIQKTELELQRKELELQRIEMQATRKEFLISRNTSIIYSQLDRFEKTLNEFIIKYNNEEFVGIDAISLFFKNNYKLSKMPLEEDDVYEKRIKELYLKFADIFLTNKSSITKFSQITFNYVEVLKNLLLNSKLEIEELNEQKDLFFENIGFITMHVIELIGELGQSKSPVLTIPFYLENRYKEIMELMMPKVYLQMIISFYKLRFTKENYSAVKNEWQEMKTARENSTAHNI